MSEETPPPESEKERLIEQYGSLSRAKRIQALQEGVEDVEEAQVLGYDPAPVRLTSDEYSHLPSVLGAMLGSLGVHTSSEDGKTHQWDFKYLGRPLDEQPQEPGTVKVTIKNRMYGGNEALQAQIEQARAAMRAQLDEQMRQMSEQLDTEAWGLAIDPGPYDPSQRFGGIPCRPRFLLPGPWIIDDPAISTGFHPLPKLAPGRRDARRRRKAKLKRRR